MKVKIKASICVYGANREAIVDVSDEEIDGMSEQEIENYLDEYVREWANNFIEISATRL